MEYSCLRTLAIKHKCSISKILKNFKDGKGRWCIPYETKTGKRDRYFAKYADSKEAKNPADLKTNAEIIHVCSLSTFESRLKAKVCEMCGTFQSKRFEIHHVNKVKNLKGKEFWERAMIAKRRKTLVVCRECHYKIHVKRVLLNE
jgi:hypothetical protein